MLRYIAQARDRGLGVVLITHNPHHAYPVGDRFLLLNRGRSLGDFAKAEITRDELTRLMAGGAELDQLAARAGAPAPDRRKSTSTALRRSLTCVGVSVPRVAFVTTW